MKAAQFNTYGDTSVIEINNDAENPQLTKGQILVEVKAAGINPVETAIRNGYMQQMLPLTFPATIGGDFSGIISQVSEDVTDLKVGDAVFGIANQFKGGTGSVAELVAAMAVNSSLKPTSLDDVQTAALPLVGASAVQALEEHINIQKDQKILIHGGAGGIGSLAIQIAKTHGAYVATTVSSDGVDFAKNLKADEVIDYKKQDFTTLIKEYDAVFDTVGGEITNKSLSVIKEGGILVTMSGQPDQELAQKQNITVVRQMTKGDTQQLMRLKELVEQGNLKPFVDKTFSLDNAKDAYELLENGHPKGKVVVTIS